jgi:hypothetical protein
MRSIKPETSGYNPQLVNLDYMLGAKNTRTVTTASKVTPAIIQKWHADNLKENMDSRGQPSSQGRVVFSTGITSSEGYRH